MKQMFIIYAMLLLACTINNNAQAQNADNIQRYIDRYRSLAMSEQQRTGIPAAIKLAQGIHETGAGTSPLALQANNHFGLKCKSGWTGPTFLHDDDRKKECFRKYNMDFESYQDQSNYLKENPRYASLFELSVTDYAAWAFGLRQAGYATNPKYSQMLIKLIEDYRLQEYTYAAMGNTALATSTTAPAAAPAYNNNSRRTETTNQRSSQQYAQPAQDNYQPNNSTSYGTRQPANSGYARGSSPAAATSQPAAANTYGSAQPERVSKYIDTRPKERQTITRTRQNGREYESTVDNTPSTVVKINNLKAIYGKKGDMPLQYAVRNKIRYEKFLEINDLKEEPLVADMPLYLERKHFWGIRPMHLVKYGEVMIEIAQKEGIQLKYLRDLNYMEEDEEPVPGITLELQAQAGEKPKVVKRSASPVYAQLEQQESGDQGEPEESYPGNNTPQYTQPVSTFPKNPAPVYQEEKSLFEKIKETRLAKKLLKEQEEAEKRSMTRAQQKAQRTPPPPAAQSKYIPPAPAKQQPVAQQPAQQSQYIQRTPPPAQQQPVAQQPVPSYGNQQRAPQNTYVTPNPAAEVVEEKSARELRREARERKKMEEEQPVVQQQPAPQQQKPKTELDLLKEQFDDVIYAQNANTGRQAAQAPQRQQQPAYQQTQRAQPTYQQPQQQQYQQPAQQQQTYQQPQQNQYQAQQPQYQQQGQQNQQQYQYQAQAPQGQQYQQPQPNYDPSKFYTVQRGDTAYTIAKKHGITIRQLMEWNGLDFDAIKEGQNLRVKQ